MAGRHGDGERRRRGEEELKDRRQMREDGFFNHEEYQGHEERLINRRQAQTDADIKVFVENC